ncbi:hypothetical protein AAHC03_01783 [Spirometra sp. Aus1]
MLLICIVCIDLILATRALPMPLNYPPGSAMTPSPAAGSFPLFWPSFMPVMPAFFVGISPPGTERTTLPTIYIKITNDNQQSEPSPSQPSHQNSSEPQNMNGEGGGPPSTSVLVRVEDSRTNRTASGQQYAAATAVPATVRTEFVLPEPGTISALPVPAPSPQASPLAVQPSSSETRSLIIPAPPSAIEQQPALQTPTEAAALLAAQPPVATPQRSRKKASSSAGTAEEQAALEQLFQTALLAEMLHQLQAAQNGVVGPHGGLPQSSANIQPA